MEKTLFVVVGMFPDHEFPEHISVSFLADDRPAGIRKAYQLARDWPANMELLERQGPNHWEVIRTWSNVL